MKKFSNLKLALLNVKNRLWAARKKISIILSIIFLVLFGLLHLRLVANTFYVDEANNLHTTREGYGDIPLHLTQISKFAFADHFDLNEPIYYGTKLQYPFLFNLLRGWLLALTGAWTASVLWPVFILALANIALLFAIYKKLLKNNGLAVVAFLIFFLGSGMGAWSYIHGAIINHNTIGEFTSVMNRDYISTIYRSDANYPNQNIAFGAPLSLVFVHQQTFFLGFFGFLLFLHLLLLAEASSKKRYFIGAGLIFGCLPLAHTHSFVAAAAVLFIALLSHLGKNYLPYLKKLLLISGIGIIMALPQLYFLLSSKNTLNANADFARFRLGWMMEPGLSAIQFPTSERSIFSSSFLNFLWLNFGIILPLFLLCLALTLIFYRRIKEENKDKIILFGFSGLLLFIAVQLIKFQPWDFDNNKLLVYFLFFASPFIIWSLAYVFRQRQSVQIPIIIIVLILSTFSGVINLIPPLSLTKANLPVIFNADARKLAEFIRSNVNDKDLILTGTTHLNPVSSLAGRPVLEGYPGWLWSRGIDYAARDSEINQFYRSPDSKSQLFHEYPIAYILLENSAPSKDRATEETFDRLFPRVFQAGKYTLYSVPKNY